MDVIAVEGGKNQIGIGRVPHHLIEVDHAVKARLRPDPFIDLVARSGLRRSPPRVVCGRGPVVARDDGHPMDLEPARVHALDDCLGSGDHLLGGRLTPDVIGPHEEDDVGDTGMREDVPLQSLQSRGAGGGGLEALADHRVPADALVDDGPPRRGVLACVEPYRHPVLPAVVGIDGRARAVGDRVAERDNGATGRRRQHVNRFEPPHRGHRVGEPDRGLVGGQVAGAIRAGIRRHQCPAVKTGYDVRVREVQAHREVLSCEYGELNGVAVDTATRRNRHTAVSTESQRMEGAGNQCRPSHAVSDRRGPDA